MKVNAKRVEALVAVPLSMAPTAIMMAPMPAAFLTPILSAMKPAGIGTAISIRVGAL